jgi:ATP-dependent 26S proteasome regulatory subunit
MAILSRIMVGLPSAENRETILKTLLAKGKHEDIDFKELSTMTEGYSGSDLKVQFIDHSLFHIPYFWFVVIMIS